MARNATALLAIAEQEDIDRFWSQVRKGPGCWTWTGPLMAKGYGIYRIRGSASGAHRFAYELEAGPIADELVIDHLCRNRSCVRPSHLEPVTQRENLLRGSAPSMRAHVAGVCIRGHDITDEANLYVSPDGKPRCRACLKAERRRRYQRYKQQHNIPDRSQERACSVGGCDEAHYAKDYCRHHYDQQRRGRPIC